MRKIIKINKPNTVIELNNIDSLDSLNNLDNPKKINNPNSLDNLDNSDSLDNQDSSDNPDKIDNQDSSDNPDSLDNQDPSSFSSQISEYVLELISPGASVELVGLFDVGDLEQVSKSVIIHHKASHTRAEVILKAVVREQAFIRFKGKIIIDHQCGDIQSFLTERVLMLAATSRAETIPDLEINNSDVSCSHAASISTINKSQLFYLMSRGLSRQQAQNLIAEAFLQR